MLHPGHTGTDTRETPLGARLPAELGAQQAQPGALSAATLGPETHAETLREVSPTLQAATSQERHVGVGPLLGHSHQGRPRGHPWTSDPRGTEKDSASSTWGRRVGEEGAEGEDESA